MALRAVTVEVVAAHTVTVIADNATEARIKAKETVLQGIVPDYIVDATILDVQPITKTNFEEVK